MLTCSVGPPVVFFKVDVQGLAGLAHLYLAQDLSSEFKGLPLGLQDLAQDSHPGAWGACLNSPKIGGPQYRFRNTIRATVA